MRKRLEFMADRIEAVFASNKVTARVTGGTVTPRWVRFQVLPAIGARISKITNLGDEIAAALDAPSVRMNRRGAAIAVEVPRADPQAVNLIPLYRQLQENANGHGIPACTAILGLAQDGAPLLLRLTSPDVAHVLIAGTTGSGKTVLQQTMALSLAMVNTPSELIMIMIDPKDNAFSDFARLPHLARPIITSTDETIEALHSLVKLMERTDPRNMTHPRVAVFIDEMADLLLTGGRDVQVPITRLTQRGREAGIHIVAATQKPTSAVLGPLVKANFPVRLVGRVTSVDDARTATGWSGSGAERLNGRGDFVAIAEGRCNRFQVANIRPSEILQITTTLRDLHAAVTLRTQTSQSSGNSSKHPLAGILHRLSREPTEPARPTGKTDRNWTITVQTEGKSIDLHPLTEAEQAPMPAPQQAIVPPAPAHPEEPPEEQDMAHKLFDQGWNPFSSIRSACRALDQSEGGNRFAVVRDAIDHLKALYADYKVSVHDRLVSQDFDPNQSYFTACRILDEPETGYKMAVIMEVVNELREEATEADMTEPAQKVDLVQEALEAAQDIDPALREEADAAAQVAEPAPGWVHFNCGLDWRVQGMSPLEEEEPEDSSKPEPATAIDATAIDETKAPPPETPTDRTLSDGRSSKVAESHPTPPSPPRVTHDLTVHPTPPSPPRVTHDLTIRVLQAMASSLRINLATCQMLANLAADRLPGEDRKYMLRLARMLDQAQHAMRDGLTGIASQAVANSIDMIIIGDAQPDSPID